MRTSLTLVCTFALLASPYFFAYLEAERLLGWPEVAYRWLDPWLPLAMILAVSLITIALPWIVCLFGDKGRRLQPESFKSPTARSASGSGGIPSRHTCVKKRLEG